MDFWKFVVELRSWLSGLIHWRMNVCLWGGVLLACAVSTQISHEPLKWIADGVILISAVVIGWRWDHSRN